MFPGPRPSLDQGWGRDPWDDPLYVEVKLPKMAISLTANGKKQDEPVDFGVPVLGQVQVF